MSEFAPQAKNLLETFRFKGLSSSQMLQELIDNSREYGATRIGVYFISDKGTSLHRVYILDDGKGMNSDRFNKCMKIAEKSQHVKGADGKFGLGLKNATFAMGDSIFLLSKTKDGCKSGLWCLIPNMIDTNSYEPTSLAIIENDNDISNTAAYEKIEKNITDSEVIKIYNKQKSGTLICVKDIRGDAPNINVAATDLSNVIQFSYKNLNCEIDIYTSETCCSHKILNTKDIFYNNSPLKVSHKIKSKLLVYLDKKEKTVEHVIEKLEEPRFCKPNNKVIYNEGPFPLYNTFNITRGKHIKRTDKVVTEKDLPKDLPCYKIDIQIVTVLEQTFEEESKDPVYGSLPNKRNGLFIYRGNRLMDSNYFPNGCKDDPHSNYVRMGVTYPPELDEFMGTRTEKVTGKISSVKIDDALHVIFSNHCTGISNIKKKEKQEMSDSDNETNKKENKGLPKTEKENKGLPKTEKENKGLPKTEKEENKGLPKTEKKEEYKGLPKTEKKEEYKGLPKTEKKEEYKGLPTTEKKEENKGLPNTEKEENKGLPNTEKKEENKSEDEKIRDYLSKVSITNKEQLLSTINNIIKENFNDEQILQNILDNLCTIKNPSISLVKKIKSKCEEVLKIE
jgi:hypothetical protein